jgi:N-acetylmuramoyl-L-alanine amidase
MNLEIRNHILFVEGKPAPYRKTPNVSGHMTPDTIVNHDTASNPLDPSGDIGWLTAPRAKASAHVVIGWNGTITQLAPFNRKTWHAGASKYGGRSNFNEFSIGIEHDNPGYLRRVRPGVYQGVCTIDTRKHRAFKVARVKTPAHGDHCWLAYSDRQIAASTALHAALAAAYPIRHVLAHWQISPGRKTDTNPLFPLEQMRAIVLGEADGANTVLRAIEDPAQPPFMPDATVTADTLNLRGGPGIRFPVKGTVPFGTRLDVQETDRLTGWHRVVTPARATGYVHAGFVSLD